MLVCRFPVNTLPSQSAEVTPVGALATKGGRRLLEVSSMVLDFDFDSAEVIGSS